MRKTVLVLSAMILINVTGYIYSCNTCGKNTVVPTNCYSLQGAFLNTYGAGGDTVRPNETVKWSDMRLGLSVTYDVKTCTKLSTNAFINHAYACDPVIKERYTDSIVGISIYSNNDFDTQHSAGYNLNKYFSGTYIADFRRSFGNDGYSFVLIQQPADKGTHTFSVNLDFSNGIVRKVEGAPVCIIK